MKKRKRSGFDLGRFHLMLVFQGAFLCCRMPSPPPRHLIVVTIDTLRADRLGCYGASRVSTPNLDRIAGEGVLVEDATVHAPLTRPSHISLFTGRYPFEHGIRDNIAPTLAEDVPTLAEILKARGFSTPAFVSSIVLASQSGLDRGFDSYGDTFPSTSDGVGFLDSIQKRGDETTRETVEWLKSQGDARVFVWLHLYDPHDPYEPPEPYASRYAESPYDGEVAWSDELVGRLDAALAELGMKDDTLFIVTSDHGEALGEHGETGHGYFVYETTLAVPLIFRGPGILPGARLDVTVGSVDLVPTILDILGIDRPPEIKLSGRSVADVLGDRGNPPSQEPMYAESLTPLLHYGWSDLRSVRMGRWKYIRAPRPELYDVRREPPEGTNLVGSEKERLAELRESLDTFLTMDPGPGARRSSGEIAPELIESLGALGYLGSTDASPENWPGVADPKDKVDAFHVANRLIREGLILLHQKDYRESAERFGGLLARGIESFEAHYYLARALMGLDRFDEASGHLERAIEKSSSYAPAYLDLAECRLKTGDRDKAIEVLARGQGALPKSARLHEREGEIWLEARRLPEAMAAFEKVVALAPGNALARVRLGEIHRDVGDVETAIRFLQQAVSIDPAPASYWNSLGMVLGGAGRLTEAEDAFRRAVERDRSNPQHTYNLGLSIMRQGRGTEAAPWFEETLALDPGFHPARERLKELAGGGAPIGGSALSSCSPIRKPA